MDMANRQSMRYPDSMMNQVMDDKMMKTNYSGMTQMTNYSGQRPGRMGHVIENDEQTREMANRVVGKVNLRDVDKDPLREYF